MAAVRIEAHGIAIEAPRRWEARIFRHDGGEPTLHAASFALPASDGEFGSRATARMPRGGMFVSLTEYRPGQGLQPGRGLFSATEPPSSLSRGDFHPRTLLIARPGQEGVQRFFTAQGRPFCLYAVLDVGDGAVAAGVGHPHLGALNRLLRSLAVLRRPTVR